MVRRRFGRGLGPVAMTVIAGAVILLVPTAIISLHSATTSSITKEDLAPPSDVAPLIERVPAGDLAPGPVAAPFVAQPPPTTTKLIPATSSRLAPTTEPPTTTTTAASTTAGTTTAPSTSAPSTSAPSTSASIVTPSTSAASTGAPDGPSTPSSGGSSTASASDPSAGSSSSSSSTTSTSSSSVSTPKTIPPSTSPPPATTTGAAWNRDFFDDFATTTLGSTWGKYGYGEQAPGQGAMGLYSLSNVFTSGGNMVLRTQYAGGKWTSAGVSSGDGFAAYQGKWEVKARFENAKGIGFVFLLYPDDGSWPPEVDMAEGRVSDPNVMATLHWDSTNQQRQSFVNVPDMTAWHTYGVIMTANKITYTLDGQPWESYTTANVPTKKMWIGFQTGPMACPSSYECVAGNVPNADTPAVSNIYIDWVAHYAAG